MVNVLALAAQCGLLLVDQGILEAIVWVESRGNPHALAVNGDVELVRDPRNREEAVAMARWLAEHGYNFDAGLAQVNSANLARLGLDVASVFDPCTNLRAASRILSECYERALLQFGAGDRAVSAAISCYNTGHFTRGVRNGYVAAVRASAAGPLLVRSDDAEGAPKSDAMARRGGGEGQRREARGGGARGPRGRRRAEVFEARVRDVFAESDARTGG